MKYLIGFIIFTIVFVACSSTKETIKNTIVIHNPVCEEVMSCSQNGFQWKPNYTENITDGDSLSVIFPHVFQKQFSCRVFLKNGQPESLVFVGFTGSKQQHHRGIRTGSAYTGRVECFDGDQVCTWQVPIPMDKCESRPPRRYTLHY